MNSRRSTSKFAPWLLALVLIAVQVLAIAHAVQHDLQKHDDPSCVLHLHTKHAGQASANATFLVVDAATAAAPEPATSVFTSAPALGYHTRAPPHSSSRSN